jgi:hypothetical protein
VDNKQNTETTDGKLRNAAQQPLVEHPSYVENASPDSNETSIVNPNGNNNTSMEVHHPRHLTQKKKWNEYLSEFFMLFFAVFLGFLMENFREHKVEEGRVEKLMHTMVENIKYDTVRLQINLRKNLELGMGLDSFRFQINEAIQGRVDANRLYYYYWKYGQDFSVPVMNDAAITQLKSAGMLRMVKSYALATEMGDYYERRRSAMMGGNVAIQKKLDELLDSYKLFFSFQGFDEIIQRDTVYSGADTFLERKYNDMLAANPPLKLINSSPAAFERLYNDVAAYELALRSYNSYIRYTKQGADSLMKHINLEYGFEP